jgi:hypothetical protein
MSDQATIDDEVASAQEATLEIADGIKTVQGSVALFDKIKAGIAAIQAEHPADLAIDLTTPAGMKRAIAGRAAWRDPRIALGKARQAAKAPVLALGRQIDAFAASVEGQLRAGESHYHGMIEAEEARREEERQAKARAEEERQQRQRQRVDSIRAVAARAVGLPSAQIAEKLALVTRLTIGDDYEEFAAVAINAKAETVLQLQDMHAAALKAEEAAAEAERNRIRLAELERENSARLEREAAERREQESAREAERIKVERRAAQVQAASSLTNELRQIQRRGVSASSAGMLELVTLVESITIGEELGDFEEQARTAKEETLADLHQMHAQKIKAEADAAAAARLVGEPAAAGPSVERVTLSSLRGMVEMPTVSTGEIARRLGFALRQDFIEGTLGIEHAGQEKRAILWRESQWQEIKAALVRHVEALA